ncbi:MAG: hypothetical protein ACUVUC_09155 [Thermoguttaceae bacterium]
MKRCPKCGAALKVLADGPPRRGDAPTEPGSAVHVDDQPGLSVFRPPERLNRQNKYYICDKNSLIATWQHDGQGWMIRGEYGFVSAARNPDKIPQEGDFRLVELQLHCQDENVRLVGIRVFRLPRRWALVDLARGDDAILRSVTGPGSLGKEQKNAVRQQIKQQFMPEVWQEAHAVLDYLASPDYHWPGTTDRP